MERHRIFISHFSQEQPLAEAVKNVVKTAFAGHAKIFVSSDIAKGANWLDEVRQRLLDSDEIFTLFSHRSADRPWLNIETGFGVISGKPVTPILFGGFRVRDLSPVFQLHEAVDSRNDLDICRFFADVLSRIRKQNDEAAPRWAVDEFLNEWKRAVKEAIAQVPLTTRRKTDRPVIWLMGSHSHLESSRERSAAMQVSQVIAKVCLFNHYQIVSGASRLLEYLADEYENYRDYFTENPDAFSRVENEPLRKYISSEHALNAASAPNPVILLGSLRHKSARATFDDAIGEIPDLAILIGGSLRGRSPKEQDVAYESKIPLLPIRFTGGTAATIQHTLHPTLDTLAERIQGTEGKMDEFAEQLVDIIQQQVEVGVGVWHAGT